MTAGCRSGTQSRENWCKRKEDREKLTEKAAMEIKMITEASNKDMSRGNERQINDFEGNAGK